MWCHDDENDTDDNDDDEYDGDYDGDDDDDNDNDNADNDDQGSDRPLFSATSCVVSSTQPSQGTTLYKYDSFFNPLFQRKRKSGR